MHVLEIENLSFTYPGASKPTLDHISLQVEQGDFLAIVGNNGCGKSTFCKTLNGLIPHFITGDFEGSVRACGLDTQSESVSSLARKIGYVYQDFENQIVRPTVLDDASYACLNYALPDYMERGRAALARCGLAGKENDYIWQLSGGQTHLLALAGAASLQPDVLILDEPIAQLDPKHAAQIYRVLKELNETYGKTIIVIEHHTEFIASYCKNVLLLRDGQAIWKKPTAEALRQVDELEACNIFPPQITRAAYALKRQGCLPAELPLPISVEEGAPAFSALPYREPTPPAAAIPGETVVRFEDVSVSYRAVKGEPHTVFDRLSFDIRKGEKIALIGSNGAGKSTIMKLLTGLLKPRAGELLVNGNDVQTMKKEDLSRQVSLVYQNPEEMFIKDSIEGDIAYAMQVRDIPNWQERTAALLERFHLTALKDRDGRLLSGGQMRRASLAIGIALEPTILLLDEPTANLDIATRKEIVHTLNDMQTETVMIATHDMELVSEWADRILVLCHGQLIGNGTRNEIFDNSAIVDAVGICPPELFRLGRLLDDRARCFTMDEFLQAFGGISYE